MYYTAPIDENGNPYYVPIVVKSRDYLLGYIAGLNTAKDIITDVLDTININVDLGSMDVVLDSTRFNDILENGKHESDMSESELKEYFLDIMQDVSDKLTSTNSENDIFDDVVLKAECSCGLGFYYWKNIESIPHESFKCSNCGKVLIHYTEIDDYDYEYEGY